MNKLTNLQKTVAAISLIVLVFSVGLALIKANPNDDAYYYIGVSKLILDGKVPFVDFNLGYAPLSFYMMCPLVKLFNASFVCMLTCLYVVYGLNAYMLYRLLVKHTSNKTLAYFAIVYYLLACFFLNGKAYILEPFVTFWGLLSLSIISKRNIVWIFLAGVCCYCSYCCKQYGIGYLCLAIVYLYYYRQDNKSFANNTFILVIGAVISYVLFYLFMQSQGVTAQDEASQLQGTSYEKLGLVSMLKCYGLLFVTAPIFLIAILVYIRNFKRLVHNKMITISLLGVLGFMLSTYVRGYMHYLQLAIPFAILFSFYVYEEVKEDCKPTTNNLIYCSVLVPCLLALVIDYRIINHNYKTMYQNDAVKLAKFIPVNSKNVYVFNENLAVGYLNNYLPPCLKKYGMSNGFVESDEGTYELLMNSDYCLTGVNQLKRLRKQNPEFDKYMNDNFVDVTEQANCPDLEGSVLVRK